MASKQTSQDTMGGSFQRETSEDTRQSRKRGRKQTGFIPNRSYRNVYDQRQREQINGKLKEWFTRSGAVTVALTLISNDENDYFVQYLGDETFREFVEDEYIQNKFMEVAVKGLEERSSGGKRPHTDDECEKEDVDDDIVSLLTAGQKTYLQLVVGDKCKLIGRIVKSGQHHGKLWKEEDRPLWWPLKDFRSPNAGNPRMRVEELDLILDSYRDFLLRTQSSQLENLTPVYSQELEPVEELAVPESNSFSTAMEQLKEIATNTTTWNQAVSEEFLARIPPNSSLEFLRMVVNLLPKTCGLAKVQKAWLQSDVELCVRSHVPPFLRGKREPVRVRGNDVFEAVSAGLYGTEWYSSAMRLCSVAIGLERMATIMEKLPHKNRSQVEAEILETLVETGRRSTVHLGLLAETLNVSIKCHSMNPTYDFRYDAANAWAELNVLWCLGDDGESRIYPLLEPSDKARSCLTDCAQHFGCSTGDSSIECPLCCKTYHMKCLAKIFDNCCGCHALTKVLSVKEKLRQEDSVKRMLQTGSLNLEGHLRGIIRGNLFAPKVQLFKSLDANEDALFFRGRNTIRHWLGDEDSTVAELLLGYLARIAGSEKTLANLEIGSKIVFNKWVLLPEVEYYLHSLITGF